MVMDTGGDACKQVFHTKAHRSKKAIAALPEKQKAIALGNAKADELAKEGAMAGPGFARDIAWKLASQKAKWALQTIGWWHTQFPKGWPDTTPRPPCAHPNMKKAR